MNSRVPAFLRSPAFWLLAGIFSLEFFLFDHFGARRHTPVFPRWHDQVEFLSDSYSAYEFSHARGAPAGLLNALSNSSGYGALHDFLALIVFLIAGPSRSAALSVNMLALIGWQIALYIAIARITASRALALAAAMLPLTLTGPWQNIPGSTYDFRLDHLAMCAIGITTALGLHTDRFQSGRASTFFGVAIGLTVVTRFLTGPYFALIFVGLAVWIARGTDRRSRFANLFRSFAAAATIAIPFLWVNHDAVRNYYSFSPYFGTDSVLWQPMSGLIRSLQFVAEQIVQRHLGLMFGVVVAVGAIVLALLRFRPQPSSPLPIPNSMGALFVAAPILVLTLHPQRNEVLVGAIAPGMVILACILWTFAARRTSALVRSIWAGAVVVASLAYFVRTQTVTAYPPSIQADIRMVNTIADRLSSRTQAANLKQPQLAVDHVTEALDASVLRIISYERKRSWIQYRMALPAGLADPSAAQVLERLGQSDFVFLSEEAPESPHAFDRRLAAMRPQLLAWCDTNLRATDRFTLFGRRMVLYQRREIPFP